MVTELTFEADVSEVIASQVVREDSVNNMASTCLGQAHVVADLLQRRQNHLVVVLPAAGVLLAGVDAITVSMACRLQGQTSCVDGRPSGRPGHWLSSLQAACCS